MDKIKYKKLLDNLLKINSKDKSIFLKINNIDSFDIRSKFGKEVSNKIFNSKSFLIKNIKELDYKELIENLKKIDKPEEIIKEFEQKKETLFNTDKIYLEFLQKILNFDLDFIYKKFKIEIDEEINVYFNDLIQNDPDYKKSKENKNNQKLLDLVIDKKLNKLIKTEDFDKLKNEKINEKIIFYEQEFFNFKKNLIDKLENKVQKSINRWKMFHRKIVDLNTQSNIWPLHIATFFIKVRTNDKVIYGPLLLKETNLIINNNQSISIFSEDDWKINEKLLFLLGKSGFELEKNFNLNEKTAIDCIKKICPNLNLNFNDINFIENYKNFSKDEIKNQLIEIESGIILGLFNPSGSHLRKSMIEIIKRNEVDKILDSDFDKNIYKNKVENFIINKSENIIRIQNSNYSQDKALISSLIQDTVIWGPPGTGKSQVIVNLIANILYKNKTAIVVSQKKLLWVY